MIDPHKILFRASCMSLIMKNDRSGKNMGETCKSYCKKLYRELLYERHEEVTTKQMEKGKSCEESGITLYSLHTKTFFKKNEENIKNMFFSGTPDIFKGESILKAEEGADIKCPYTLFTMPFPSDELDDSYYFQNMTYCALTGAKKWTTAYTLVSLPASQLDDEKRKWGYKLGIIDTETDPIYIEKCKELERLHIVDMVQFRKDYEWYDLATDLDTWKYDIPRDQRIVTFEVKRDEEVIKQMQVRVLEARNYIQKELIGK